MQNQLKLNHCLIHLSTTINEQLDFALKDQSQIPYFIDTLSRKQNHHLLIENAFSKKIQTPILESLALQLTSSKTPAQLQEAELIYIDCEHLALLQKEYDVFSHFQQMTQQANQTNKIIIVALSDTSLLQTKPSQQALYDLSQLLQTQLLDDHWRFVVFNSSHAPATQPFLMPDPVLKSRESNGQELFNPFHLKSLFSCVRLNEPNKNETLAILKTFRNDLETFHQVIISEDIFPYALSLTTHYLGGKSHLDKTVALLDSSAAHASTTLQTEQAAPPTLTTTLLAEVVSQWCGIPTSHLHHNKFKLSQLLPHLQQKIIGQDAALNTIGLLLQTTCIPFNKKTGTLCNLLITGPDGVGKREFANALSDYLFTTQEALLHIIPLQNHRPYSLSHVFVTTGHTQSQHIRLLDAIQNKPYAILYFDNIDETSAEWIALFKDIFIQGYAYDELGNFYDFRHAIILLTTTLGAERINNLSHHHKEKNQTSAMDLMQLVLNEPAHQTSTEQHLTQDEINQQILPCLVNCFSTEIISHLHIIPFVPLEQATIEKIITKKISDLATLLEKDFGITLTYATEVIKFLAHETMKQKNNAHALDKLFEYYINSKIANEILARMNDSYKPKRLALLLNETGQLLRCEFIKTHEPAHAIGH